MSSVKEKLWNSCYEGKLKDVQDILSKKPELLNEGLDSSGYTALIVASLRNQLAVVKHLLSLPSIDVNKGSNGGSRPLILSCYNNYKEITQLLLAHPDIMINCRNKDGDTPLHYASRYGYTATVKLLLSHDNIDTDIRNNDDQTAYDDCCGDIIDQSQFPIIRKMLDDHANNIRKRAESLLTPQKPSAVPVDKEAENAAKIAALELELRELREELKEKEETIAEKEEDLIDAKQIIEEMKGSNDRIAEEKNSVVRQLKQEIEGVKTTFQAQLSAAQAENTRLLAFCDVCQGELVEAQAEIQRLRMELHTFETPPLPPSLNEALVNLLPQETHAFLTHNWGNAQNNFENHRKVAKIYKLLEKRGLKMWFDEEYLESNLLAEIVSGVNHTKCMVVFITKEYDQKINGHDSSPYCMMEFDRGFKRFFTHGKLIPIVMEKEMLNPQCWSNKLVTVFGEILFHDFTKIGDWSERELEQKCNDLFTLILNKIK